MHQAHPTHADLPHHQVQERNATNANRAPHAAARARLRSIDHVVTLHTPTAAGLALPLPPRRAFCVCRLLRVAIVVAIVAAAVAAAVAASVGAVFAAVAAA